MAQRLTLALWFIKCFPLFGSTGQVFTIWLALPMYSLSLRGGKTYPKAKTIAHRHRVH